MMSKTEQEELFNELVKESESSQDNNDTGTIDPELLTQCSISKEKWLEETNK